MAAPVWPAYPPASCVYYRHINAWMCRIYCHKVIKLSDAVQPLPRQDTMFVHGVSPSFLQVRGIPMHRAVPCGRPAQRTHRACLAFGLQWICLGSRVQGMGPGGGAVNS